MAYGFQVVVDAEQPHPLADWWAGARGSLEAECERLTATGARFLHRASQGPHAWVTLADPEGNEFCLQPT